MGNAIGGLWKSVQKGRTDNSEQIRGEDLLDGLIELCWGALAAMVPPLRGRRAGDGAEEKAGHSGRDDRWRKRQTQEHRL